MKNNLTDQNSRDNLVSKGDFSKDMQKATEHLSEYGAVMYKLKKLLNG